MRMLTSFYDACAELWYECTTSHGRKCVKRNMIWVILTASAVRLTAFDHEIQGPVRFASIVNTNYSDGTSVSCDCKRIGPPFGWWHVTIDGCRMVRWRIFQNCWTVVPCRYSERPANYWANADSYVDAT
jgi:hypothetical protein